MQLLLIRNRRAFKFFVYLNGFTGLLCCAIFVFDWFIVFTYHVFTDFFGLVSACAGTVSVIAATAITVAQQIFTIVFISFPLSLTQFFPGWHEPKKAVENSILQMLLLRSKTRYLTFYGSLYFRVRRLLRSRKG
jgi:hypothetical protein